MIKQVQKLYFQTSIFAHPHKKNMNGAFQPAFLTNCPSTMCDQILYLVKNSCLNFELHETPFSLNLKLKKSFAKFWNKTGQIKQNHVPQHVIDPGQQPHNHCQPGPLPGNLPQQQNQANVYNGSKVHQHQHLSQDLTDPFHQADHPAAVGPHGGHLSDNHTQSILELLKKIDSMKAEHQEVLKENSEALEDYAELDKAHRKLFKEHKDLQAKHTKICSDIKKLKHENEIVLKENNELSVALKSSKKNTEINFRNHVQELESYQRELATLMEFKTQQEEEIRKNKRMEKKKRQKERRKSTLLEDKLEEEAELENDLVPAVPVSNPFEPLGKISTADLEDKDETANLETDPNLSSRDINQNKPPDNQTVEPQPETKENVIEMNAAEFSKLLDECITNFSLRSK